MNPGQEAITFSSRLLLFVQVEIVRNELIRYASFKHDEISIDALKKGLMGCL